MHTNANVVYNPKQNFKIQFYPNLTHGTHVNYLTLLFIT